MYLNPVYTDYHVEILHRKCVSIGSDIVIENCGCLVKI